MRLANQIDIKLPAWMYNELKAEATKEGVSVQTYMKRVLKDSIKCE